MGFSSTKHIKRDNGRKKRTMYRKVKLLLHLHIRDVSCMNRFTCFFAFIRWTYGQLLDTLLWIRHISSSSAHRLSYVYLPKANLLSWQTSVYRCRCAYQIINILFESMNFSPLLFLLAHQRRRETRRERERERNSFLLPFSSSFSSSSYSLRLFQWWVYLLIAIVQTSSLFNLRIDLSFLPYTNDLCACIVSDSIMRLAHRSR